MQKNSSHADASPMRESCNGDYETSIEGEGTETDRYRSFLPEVAMTMAQGFGIIYENSERSDGTTTHKENTPKDSIMTFNKNKTLLDCSPPGSQ